MAESGNIINRGKSVSMIRSQWDRINNAISKQLWKAPLNLSGRELEDEQNRLLGRSRRVNDIFRRYKENIHNQPDQRAQVLQLQRKQKRL